MRERSFAQTSCWREVYVMRKMVICLLLVALCISHKIDMTSAAYRGDQAYSRSLVRALPLRDIPPVTMYDTSSQGRVYVPKSDLRYHRYSSPNQASLNFDDQIHKGQDQGRSCYRFPSYTHFNLSDNSYYYPSNNINQELTERKDVLEQIFKDGVKATSSSSEEGTLYYPTYTDLQSSVGEGVQKAGYDEGCTGYRLLLRSFDSYGGHCWMVYPRHQAVSFVSCGAPRCQGYNINGRFGACAVDEVTHSVWAWCETLPYGKRVTKVYLPLPVACKCQVYDC